MAKKPEASTKPRQATMFPSFDAETRCTRSVLGNLAKLPSAAARARVMKTVEMHVAEQAAAAPSEPAPS